MPRRSAPLARGTGLERGTGLVRRVPLRAVSAARQAENRLRRAMANQMFPERPLCVVYELSQVNPGLIPAEVISRCGRWADDLHEPLSRGRGGGIADPGNWATPCRPCHDEITFRPDSELGWAYALGLKVHSWPGQRLEATEGQGTCQGR